VLKKGHVDSVNYVYRNELQSAFTEYLLGESKDLPPLSLDDPRIRYYVSSRRDGEQSVPVASEEKLFQEFWPPGQREQVIFVIGGAGAGKSTFLRYVFQYYIPHRPVLRGHKRTSEIYALHQRSLSHHILAYADLASAKPLKEHSYDRLHESISTTAKRCGFEYGGATGGKSEDVFRPAITELAQQVEAKKRRWYLSWVLDNADHLNQTDLKMLMRVVREYVPDIPPKGAAEDPVVADSGRDLWRVVIPVRPETWLNLHPLFATFKNFVELRLPDLDSDVLVRLRAVFLRTILSGTTRHFETNVNEPGQHRPYFHLDTPREMAARMNRALVQAYRRGPTGVSPEAREVFDDLANGSARRLLSLLPRAAFSETIQARRARAQQEHWVPPQVSDFYFFDGLIRGDEKRFIADSSENKILNLYNLGAPPAMEPHTTFVGLHSVYLLGRGDSWHDVWTKLVRLGYRSEDMLACREWLVDMELLKPLWSSQYQVELRIAKAHWRLLRERAYTDNMAVVCASAWGLKDKAGEFDPLDYGNLLPRCSGGIWFIEEIWRREKDVRRFRQERHREFTEFSGFSRFYTQVGLPCVTHYVASEYRKMLGRVITSASVRTTVEQEKERWSELMARLDGIVSDAARDDAVKATQQ
jgi:hypothetical protein